MSKSNSSFFRRLGYLILQVTVVLAAIYFTPGLPPHADFTHYKLDIKSVPFNGKLNNAEKLFVDKIKGPEDFAVYKNELYMTTHGGFIQKLSGGKLMPVAKFGKECKGFLHEEEICGRPLGIAFDSKGTLYAADAYYGIFQVNVTTGQFINIASLKEPIDGKLPMLPNALDVSKKGGDIYWSDSSTTHKLYDGVHTVLHDGNGRLIKYDAAKKKNSVLIPNLHFANGVALSGDESFIVVAETFRARLWKYYLKGKKTGQYEVFADLPGFPDNVKNYGDKFYVSFIAVPDELIRTIPEWPVLRKLAARLLAIVEFFIDQLNSLYPNDTIKGFTHLVGHFESILAVSKPSPLFVAAYSPEGKLLEVLSSTDNKARGGSSCFINSQGYYYLGSPYNNYLTRVKTP